MMNEMRTAMAGVEEPKKLPEDCSRGQVRGQEFTEIRENPSRKDKRNAKRTRRLVQGPLSRRWSRRMNRDEACRAPSLFTWRC